MTEIDRAVALRQSISLLRRVFSAVSEVRPLAERHLCAARAHVTRAIESANPSARSNLVAARIAVDAALVACREGTRRMRSMLRSDIRVLESRLDGLPEMRGALRTLPRLVLEPYAEARGHIGRARNHLAEVGLLSDAIADGLATVDTVLGKTLTLLTDDLAPGVLRAREALLAFDAGAVVGRHARRPGAVPDDIDLGRRVVRPDQKLDILREC